MQIVHRKEIYKLVDSGLYFQNINMIGRQELSIVDQFRQLYQTDEILKILQTFNTRIIEINLESRLYIVNMDERRVRVTLDCLSSGERLFMLCYMADKLNISIVVHNECEQLDLEHIKMLYKLWYTSPYINIVFNKEGMMKSVLRLVGRSTQ